MSINSNFDPSDLQLPPPDPKAQSVTIKRADGSIFGQSSGSENGSSSSKVATPHDTISTAKNELDPNSDAFNIMDAMPAGNPEQQEQHLYDTADPRNPTLPFILTLVKSDQSGGIQQQVKDLSNNQSTPTAVFNKAFDKAMSKYQPPLTQAQTQLINQHKQAYFKDSNNPQIPENAKKLLEECTKQAAHEVHQQTGLPESFRPTDAETENAQAKQLLQGDEKEPAASKSVTAKDSITSATATQLAAKAPETSAKPSVAGGTSGSGNPAGAAAAKEQSKVTAPTTVKLEAGVLSAGAAAAEKASGNPFLGANMYLSFVMAFIECAKIMMQMKAVEGMTQIAAQNAQWELTKATSDSIISQTNNEVGQMQTDAICQGIGILGSAVSLGMSLGAAGTALGAEAPEPTIEGPGTLDAGIQDVPPREPELTDGETTNANGKTQQEITDHNKNVDAIEARNTKVRARNNEIKSNNNTIETNNKKINEQKAQIDRNNDTIKNSKDEKAVTKAKSDNLDLQKSNKNLVSENKELATRNSELAKGNDPELKTPKQANARMGAKAEADNQAATIKEQQIEYAKDQKQPVENRTVKKPQSALEENTAIADENKAIVAKNEALKPRNDAIQARNDRVASARESRVRTMQATGQAVGQFVTSVTSTASAAVKSVMQTQIGQEKAKQELLRTEAQVEQTLQQKMGDAFKSNTDTISQVISQMTQMRSKLMDAVSQMIHH